MEDQQIVLNLCNYALRQNGFDLILAQNGEEGLSAFTEHIDEIDAVLADVAMPKMDGIEMVRRMLTQKPNANIILMTGPPIEVPGDLQKICGLLQKPFVVKQLLEAVGNCLRGDAGPHYQV